MQSNRKPGASSSKLGEDVISLLSADHKKVRKLFKDFEKIKEESGMEDEKAEIASQICSELSIHTQIEEEVFYPACHDAIKETDLLDEAEVEHACAKELISQIESMQPDDELFAAKVTVLGEYVNHHIEEEEGELFPRVKKVKMDIDALGQEILELKEELQSEIDIAPELSARSGTAKKSPGRRSSH